MNPITINDWNTDEEVPVKQFIVDNYIRRGKDHLFSTEEEALEYINKRIQKSPFETDPYFVLEVKQMVRSVPVAETAIQTINMKEYTKQLEETKEDGI